MTLNPGTTRATRFGQLELSRRHPIGNRQSIALVSADASIDWWSPAGIEHDAALYGVVHTSGGAVRLGFAHRDTNPFVVGSCAPLAPGSNTIRTSLQTPDCLVTVDDHLSDGHDGFSRGTIVRLIVAQQGEAHLYGAVVPGSAFGPARRTFQLSDGVAWTAAGLTATAICLRGLSAETVILRPGEHVLVTLSATGRDERVRREDYDRSMVKHERTWRQLTETSYDGPYRLEIRSALRQLLLLGDLETGALFRSATTSLPMQLGHERQFDERAAWLDDGARWVRLCERLSRPELAEQTRNWLAEAVWMGPQSTRRSSGEPVSRAIDLGLEGWRGHTPVRKGSTSPDAFDLAALAAASLVLDGNRHRRSVVAAAKILDAVCSGSSRWVDTGRWAAKADKAQSQGPTGPSGPAVFPTYVSGMIAARRALGAASATERRHDPLSEPAADWYQTARKLGERLRADGCFGYQATAGWRRRTNDDSSDAQLLRWVAPPDPDTEFPDLPGDSETEPRIRTTNAVRQLMAQLDDGGLVHRHLPHVDDGFAPGQDPDVSATADVVTALCRLDRWEEAHTRMEQLLRLLSPADNMMTAPAAIDARTGEHRGNRPYAPALLSVVEAGMALGRGPR
jgi:hypothetical protein